MGQTWSCLGKTDAKSSNHGSGGPCWDPSVSGWRSNVGWTAEAGGWIVDEWIWWEACGRQTSGWMARKLEG